MHGTVELKDVVFAYPARPDVRVFNGLCLTVPAGKTLALVRPVCHTAGWHS